VCHVVSLPPFCTHLFGLLPLIYLQKIVHFVSSCFGYTAAQCTPELHTTIFNFDYVLTSYVFCSYACACEGFRETPCCASECLLLRCLNREDRC
jgi:hypothetical protein